MFRFIEIKSNGNLLVEHVSTLQLAYRLCVPGDLSRWHVKMLNALRNEVVGELPILVSYDDQRDPQSGLFTACYIQPVPRGPNTPYPQLALPDGFLPRSDEIPNQSTQNPAQQLIS
jgi:hypothetical protein